MFKPRILLFALSCWLGVVAAQAQSASQFIVLDGKKVHPTRVIVKYASNSSTQGVASVMASAGLQVHRQFIQVPGVATLNVVVPGSQDPVVQASNLKSRIAMLKNSGQFEYVEPDQLGQISRTPVDSSFVDGTLWALNNQGQSNGVAGVDLGVASSNTNAPKAWDLTIGSTNVIVAIIDTGIHATHQDLSTQLWRNPNEISNDNVDNDNNGFVDDINGIDAISRNGNPDDDNGHGTHVAGTIGAAANNGSPHVGVAWFVQLMALKAFDSGGFGFQSDVVTCIDYAINKRAKIINCSFGFPTFSQAHFDAVTRARNAGILVVAAAGNFGLDNGTTEFYPANFQIDNVISVAAIDRRGQLAAFSDFGSNTVHLGAPGVEIYSTVNTSDSSYAVFDGTSMAAPHVVGVAALIRAKYTNATLTEVRTRLLKGVKPLASLAGKTITGGMVNAYDSLQLQPDGLLEISVNPPANAPLLGGATIPFLVSVTDLAPVVNATVTGTMPGVFTNLTFLNDGITPDAAANDEVYSANVVIPPGLSGTATLTLTVSALGKATSVTTYNYVIVSPPGNDDFANAFKVPTAGGIVIGTNSFASTESFEPQHANVSTAAASVWWNWAPTTGGNTLVDMSGTTFDSIVAVYTGNTLDTLTPVVALDNLGQNRQGYTNFNAVAGTTYRIAVAGANAAEVGQIRMRLEIGGVADTTLPGVSITSPPSGAIVSNATLVVTGTASDFPQSGSGVQSVQLSLNHGLFTTVSGTNNWTATLVLQAGLNTIDVFAVDFANNRSPTATISVTLRVFDPPNDFFFNAIALPGVSGTVSNNTTKATRETGESNHAGVISSNSIWYYFVAPADGVLYLNTMNSSFDTLLAVYTGTRVDQLTPLLSNDDAGPGVVYSQVTQPVQANQTYHIAVDGIPGQTGGAILNYAFSNIPIYSVTVTTTAGGTASPGSAQYLAGSTIQLLATASAGYDFVSWEGSAISQANPLSLVVDGNLSIGATFLPHLVSDDFETGNLTKLKWTTAGALPWAVQQTNVNETNTILGKKFFARSGAIGDSQTSALTLKATNIAGTGSFSYRVSCEAGYEHFEFYLNQTNLTSTNNYLLRASPIEDSVGDGGGDTGWLKFTFNVPAGTNTFQWRYVKDQNTSKRLDAAYIDDVDLPLVVPHNGTTPATFNFISQTGTNVVFRVFGQTNQVYLLQASPDLANWQTISTNVAIHGIIQITDTNANQTPNRFYRAISP